jgi:hypothetical protein
MKQQIKKSWRKAAGDGPGITPTVAASVTFVLFMQDSAICATLII